MRRRGVGALALVLALGAAAPAGAATAGGIQGKVEGPAGPLPGATISITNAALGVSEGTSTDARGEFRITPLPPGPGYSLKATFPGMAAVTVSDIQVVPGRVELVPIGLRPEGELKEQVKVVARPPVVDTAEATTQTRFSAEFIDALPILGRNYQDVLALAPGVSDVDGDGNPNIHGARDTDVVTLVDGASTVDPLTGRRGQELNLDSIQEIEVKTSGVSAEFGRAQGGFVNVVTKSGGNEFEGRASVHVRSYLLDGDGAGSDPAMLHGGLGDESLRDLEFTDLNGYLSVAGPIRKDRAWYFLTAEFIQMEEPVNALTQTFVRDAQQWRVFGKASWDITTANKLVFSATYDPQTYDDLGVDSFVAEEAGYTEEFGGWNLVLRDTAVFTPNAFLEVMAQYFESTPRLIPTLRPDSNGDGILYRDRNGDKLWDALETDAGDDYDLDGAWDVFERDANRNRRADPDEDRDGDRRLTPALACEGESREDLDCDGYLDAIEEDQNGDGQFDLYLEDIDGDRRWDHGLEDHNYNDLMDDRPFPTSADVIFGFPDAQSENSVRLSPTYPYGRLQPLLPDRQYFTDEQFERTFGPYNQSAEREVRRITLRQDLSVYVPDWSGQHDVKAGLVFEAEAYDQTTHLRPEFILEPPSFNGGRILDADLPTEAVVHNEASGQTLGVYLQDTFKPVPNLTLRLGVRFDHEATDAFGYTPFEPAAERVLYDRLWALGGGERGLADSLVGDGNDVSSQGFCSDPIFLGLHCTVNPEGNEVIDDLGRLRTIAPSRLTQHHAVVTLAANSLEALFPEAIATDPVSGERTVDRDVLFAQGSATFQEREAFRLTNSNLAPRLAVTWDPWADSKTRLFASWGRYYDKLFLGVVVPEEGPDTIFRGYRFDLDRVDSTGKSNYGFGRTISKSPPTGFQVERDLQTPYSDEFSVGFERELVPEVALKITYINRRFRDQLQDVDVNHYLRYGEDGRPLDAIGTFEFNDRDGRPIRAPDGRPDLFIHNFFFNQLLRVGNYDSAEYRGIELQLTRRLQRRWQMDASYTYSRAVGSAEEYLSGLGDDPAVRETEYGYLDYDQRHVVKVNGVFYLTRDWQLGTTVLWSSGLPYTIEDRFVAFDNYDYGQNRTLYGTARSTGREIDFVPIARNSERNDPFLNIDVRAEKAVVLGRTTAKLFLTVQNLLNSDDLTITVYTPDETVSNQFRAEVDAVRRFGRRFEAGFLVEF